MKVLQLAVPELEPIEINGEVFDVLMSDADIINKSANYHKKYKNADAKNIEQIQSAVNEVTEQLRKVYKSIVIYTKVNNDSLAYSAMST